MGNTKFSVIFNVQSYHPNSAFQIVNEVATLYYTKENAKNTALFVSIPFFFLALSFNTTSIVN